MIDTDEDPFVKFLLLPENLECALEVTEHIDAVKKHLAASFWNKVRSEVERDCALAGSATWKVELDSDKQLLRPFGGLRVSPMRDYSKVLSLGVSLEWESETYRTLYLAICYSRRLSEIPKEAEVAEELVEWARLKRERPDWDSGDRWMSFSYSIGDQERIQLFERNTLIHLRDGTLSSMVARALLDLFASVREPMEALNLALVQKLG